MEHKDFINGLSREQRLELTHKSDWFGFAHLLPHVILIAFFAAIVFSGVPFRWLALLPLGITVVFLFTLLHECIHRTVFATRWLNDAVAWGAGFVLILGPSWFRYFHFAHHRYTQDPEKDPELASEKPKTKWSYWWHISGLPVWKSQIATVFSNAFGRGEFGTGEAKYVPESAELAVRKEARLMIAIYGALIGVSLLLQSSILLWIWVVPALLGQPFLRLYLLAEHADCEETDNMFANTRTTFTSALVRRLAWNMPYHAEHHAMPSVPFHQLPEFHDIVKGKLEETELGYRNFNAKYYQRSLGDAADTGGG